MKPPFNRHEKKLLLISAVLLLASHFVRYGHWAHSGVAQTLVLFGLTIGIAGVAQYHKRTKIAQQAPQTPPPGATEHR